MSKVLSYGAVKSQLSNLQKHVTSLNLLIFHLKQETKIQAKIIEQLRML